MDALGLARVVVDDHQRQLDADGRAAVLARARRFDPAAMRFDEMAADRQPEAEPAVRPRERAVGLAEALEEVGQELRRDAFPGVADADLDLRVDALQPHLDAAAAGRELDRVRQQVPDHLLQPLRIARHRHAGLIDRRLQPDALRRRRRRHRFERLVDHARQVHRADVQPQLAGDDPRDVEDVADQLLLQLGVALDGLEHRRQALAAR